MDHMQQCGLTKGKVHKKQEWKHQHSQYQYKFILHHKQARAEFNTSTLWKTARKIINACCPDFIRLSYMLKFPAREGTYNKLDAKYLRDKGKDIQLR